MDGNRKITINYNYYNNLALALHIFNWYEEAEYDKDKYVFNIVDDGSQVQPLGACFVPDRWNVYTITEDKGWNCNGARNLLMDKCETEWVINIDLDKVVSEKTLQLLPDKLDSMNPYALTIFQRKRRWSPHSESKPCVNDYITSRDYYWMLGGYPEADTDEPLGYGSDFKFLGSAAKIYDDDCWADVIVPWAVGGNKDNMERKNSRFRDDGRILYKWKQIQKAK